MQSDERPGIWTHTCMIAYPRACCRRHGASLRAGAYGDGHDRHASPHGGGAYASDGASQTASRRGTQRQPASASISISVSGGSGMGTCQGTAVLELLRSVGPLGKALNPEHTGEARLAQKPRCWREEAPPVPLSSSAIRFTRKPPLSQQRGDVPWPCFLCTRGGGVQCMGVRYSRLPVPCHVVMCITITGELLGGAGMATKTTTMPAC